MRSLKATSWSSKRVRDEYLFGLTEETFKPDRHLNTGLIDIFEQPIARMQTPSKRHPIGFGRQKEWNEFDRATVSRTDSGSSPGFGEGSCDWEFEPGDFGLAEVQLAILGQT